MKLYFVIPRDAELLPENFTISLTVVGQDKLGNKTEKPHAAMAFLKRNYAEKHIEFLRGWSQKNNDWYRGPNKWRIVTTLCIPVGRPRKAGK